MSIYSNIQTIRYMGNKNKLLEFIVPEIEKLTMPGDIICDIMAGTNSIGYACKKRNIVVSNDIQYYSYVVAKCLLSNYALPSSDDMHRDLDDNYNKNKEEKFYSFFIENYTDTYFAYNQCLDIDSLRYAIEKVENKAKQYLYLTMLMSAMCKAQSTTGHFAQYMDKNHKRIIPLRELSIYDLFYSKIEDFYQFNTSSYENFCYNLDFKDLFKEDIIKKVSCFYLDSPYTMDQYSRFYHVLETVCKYDNPTLEHKAKYRNDRTQSEFCYKKSVADSFEYIISNCRKLNANLVISYSNHGVIPVEDIVGIGKQYFPNVKTIYKDYAHSSQGKGTIGINEVLIILNCKEN